jgi:hypothetical protein
MVAGIAVNLTPQTRVIDKLTVAQLTKKFFDLYGTRRLIAVLTRICHWFLS